MEPHIVFLCTGNAARSVMAGVMLDSYGGEVRVTTAGTHVIEHQPMSIRTRLALGAVGLEVPDHRSRQLTDSHIDEADLVVAMAAEHVHFVRRRHSAGASHTATIRYLAQHLRAGSEPLAQRVADMGLEGVDPDVQGDVTDPAGGDEEDYVACARQLSALMTELAPRLV